MQTKKFETAPKFAKLQELAVAIQNGAPAEAYMTLQRLQRDPAFSGKGWQQNFHKLFQVFNTQKPAFSIFALGGNSKLPFVAFSSLPGVTCPGAGACLDFCYSFRAWRYPAAFARQAQNAFLLRHAAGEIENAFYAIAAARPDGFDFRLYVDGDFAHGGDVAFWMHALKKTPNARAYGYSKSFAALLGFDAAGLTWPQNYMLNISSGHNAAPAMVEYVRALPITRGEFVAVSIGRKVKSSDHGTKENNAAIREAMGATKVFPCPGQCGSCTGAGHACGLPALQGRVIAIAVH